MNRHTIMVDRMIFVSEAKGKCLKREFSVMYYSRMVLITIP